MAGYKSSKLPPFKRVTPSVFGLLLGFMASLFWSDGDWTRMLVGWLGFTVCTVISAGTLGIFQPTYKRRSVQYVLFFSVIALILGLVAQPSNMTNIEANQQLVENAITWPIKFLLIHLPFILLLWISSNVSSFLLSRYKR